MDATSIKIRTKYVSVINETLNVLINRSTFRIIMVKEVQGPLEPTSRSDIFYTDLESSEVVAEYNSDE